MADITTIQRLSHLTPMIGKVGLQTEGTPALSPGAATGPSFADTLKDSLQEVKRLESDATKQTNDLTVGKSGNIHETMLALEKSDISMRFMMKVRTKVLDAYHEIMRLSL